MKKNQIILIGILASLLFLFFMLVYKSDNDHSFSGESKISIYVENGISLPNSDSLIQLIDLYSPVGITESVPFTQSSLNIYANGVPQEISSNPSGLAKLRNFFNSKFYTYDDRISDINEMYSNQSEYSNTLRSTSSPVPTNVDISIKISEGKPSMFHKRLKDSIAVLLAGQKKDVIVAIVNGESKVGSEPLPISEPPVDPISPPISNPPRDPKPPRGPQPPISKMPNIVTSEISFTSGNPNKFDWIRQDGFTYDFSLSCSSANCEESVSYNESDVSEMVKIKASYDESSGKSYTAILTIRYNGKVVKTISKKVRLFCS
jgi:hypothetical protein